MFVVLLIRYYCISFVAGATPCYRDCLTIAVIKGMGLSNKECHLEIVPIVKYQFTNAIMVS